MKLIILNSILLDILKKISGGIIKDTNNSNLSYILIKIIKNKIFCISINNVFEIVTYNIFDNNTYVFEIILQYNLIYNICKKSPSASKIIFNKNKKYLEIFSDNTLFKINYKNGIFPSFNLTNNHILKIKIKSTLFLNNIKYAKTAALNSDIKNFLNGIFFEINLNSINVLSSDNIRFFYSSILINNYINNKISFIIPKISINEILNVFMNTDYLYLFIYINQIKIISHRITFTSKLINDIYNLPLINLKTKYKINIMLKKNIFKEAIEKAILLKSSTDKLNFLFGKNKLIINNTNLNENINVFLNINYNLTDIIIVINYKYLLDILKILDNNTINLIIIDKFLLLTENKSNFFYLITTFNL